jgi:anti-sigma factor RsiW
MKCDDFESIITDLTRGENVSASEERQVRAHTADCERCSRFLEASRGLTSALERLASADLILQPSAELEKDLRDALRSRLDVDEIPAALLSLRSGAARLAAVAVVTLVILAGLLIFVTTGLRKPRNPNRHDNQQGRAAQTQSPPPAHLASGKREPGLKAQEKLPDQVATDQANEQVDRESEIARPPAGLHYSGLRAVNRRLPNHGRGTRAQRSTEITTDFLAVGPPGAWRPIDGGALIRVELPRSTLASYGLPVAPDRMNSLVKADVVVGEDGFPHAVRFVR